MEVIFIEHTGPDNLIKSRIVANAYTCREMVLYLTEQAFERGNYFEVRIE